MGNTFSHPVLPHLYIEETKVLPWFMRKVRELTGKGLMFQVILIALDYELKIHTHPDKRDFSASVHMIQPAK